MNAINKQKYWQSCDVSNRNSYGRIAAGAEASEGLSTLTSKMAHSVSGS